MNQLNSQLIITRRYFDVTIQIDTKLVSFIKNEERERAPYKKNPGKLKY